MKPYAVIHLKTFRVIHCEDKQTMVDILNKWKKQNIPCMPFKLNPETQSYIPLAYHYGDEEIGTRGL